MIFYYKIDFVSVADIAFKINHVGSYGVATLRYPHAPYGRTRGRSHGFRHARLIRTD